MKTTKEQNAIIKRYAKENNLTIEQVINYMVAFLETELEE